MLSRTATRSSATKPNPQKPASAMAVMRSPIGTGLVPGVSIGEVSPALDHAVATSCGWVTAAPNVADTAVRSRMSLGFGDLTAVSRGD